MNLTRGVCPAPAFSLRPQTTTRKSDMTQRPGGNLVYARDQDQTDHVLGIPSETSTKTSYLSCCFLVLTNLVKYFYHQFQGLNQEEAILKVAGR